LKFVLDKNIQSEPENILGKNQ